MSFKPLRHCKHKNPFGRHYIPLKRDRFKNLAISREQVLEELKKRLKTQSVRDPRIHELLELFHVHPEEITEIGVSFEILKALEQVNPLFALRIDDSQ